MKAPSYKDRLLAALQATPALTTAELASIVRDDNDVQKTAYLLQKLASEGLAAASNASSDGPATWSLTAPGELYTYQLTTADGDTTSVPEVSDPSAHRPFGPLTGTTPTSVIVDEVDSIKPGHLLEEVLAAAAEHPTKTDAPIPPEPAPAAAPDHDFAAPSPDSNPRNTLGQNFADVLRRIFAQTTADPFEKFGVLSSGEVIVIQGDTQIILSTRKSSELIDLLGAHGHD